MVRLVLPDKILLMEKRMIIMLLYNITIPIRFLGFKSHMITSFTRNKEHKQKYTKVDFSLIRISGFYVQWQIADKVL